MWFRTKTDGRQKLKALAVQALSTILRQKPSSEVASKLSESALSSESIGKTAPYGIAIATGMIRIRPRTKSIELEKRFV